MRRTLAGLLFGLAYACAGLTLAGFLLQRTAFSPSASADSADVVLADPAIRQEVVGVIAEGVAATLQPLAPGDPNVSVEAIRTKVDQVAGTKAGASLMAQIVRDAHARLIGAKDTPVQITGEQLVQVTRNEAAAVVPPITLDVPRVGLLDAVREALKWLLPITAIATLALAIIGLAAHPERSALFKSLGLGLLLLALLTALLGYVVPKFVVPALSDSPWANLPARLADDSLPLLVALELVLVGAGLALLAGTGVMRRRQRWSTPVSTYRYQEERRWSG